MHPEVSPGPVYNEMSHSPPDASPLPDDAGTRLSHNTIVNYGEDAYGGYDDYENHAQGGVNIATDHAFYQLT